MIVNDCKWLHNFEVGLNDWVFCAPWLNVLCPFRHWQRCQSVSVHVFTFCCVPCWDIFIAFQILVRILTSGAEAFLGRDKANKKKHPSSCLLSFPCTCVWPEHDRARLDMDILCCSMVVLATPVMWDAAKAWVFNVAKNFNFSVLFFTEKNNGTFPIYHEEDLVKTFSQVTKDQPQERICRAVQRPIMGALYGSVLSCVIHILQHISLEAWC